MKLSIIIVTFNKPNMVKDCLDSIFKFNDIGNDLEVIVSDNSTTDEVKNLVSEYKSIKYLHHNNIGFGPANNRGVDIAESNYLLFLNPDTILVEPIFEYAINIFKNNKDIALFGFKLINKDLKPNTSFAFIDQFSLKKAFKAKKYIRKDLFLDDEMYILGADMFVRRESFEEANRFDENIFMYAEENDLIKRIKLYSNCKKIAYFPEKRIIHLEGGTQNFDFSSKEIIEKLRINTYKYYCQKWNLNYNTVIKFRVRYFLLKQIASMMKFKFKNAEVFRKIKKIYKINYKNNK